LKNKSKYIAPTLNLNVNKDDAELNDFLYCWEQFESRPNKLVIHNTYSTNLFNEVLNTHITGKNFFTEVLPDDESFIINDKMFVELGQDIYCSYIVIDRNSDKSVVNELTFFYKLEKDFESIQKIVENLNDCTINFEENEFNKLNTISLSSKNEIEIEPIGVSDFDIDNFLLYYTKQTGKDINKLIKEIKKSNKGLSILHGQRGTGKTSVLNYLSSKIDRIFIFIPNNMIEHTINNSEFRKFLKRYSKPVIIIDDCEMLFHEYFTKSNMFVNNLLQMVDGLLSDSIEVNIIAIFNTEGEDEIDHLLLESNNLIRVINFQYLSPIESVELSEYIGSNKQYKNKTSVLDIIRKKKTKERKEFGF